MQVKKLKGDSIWLLLCSLTAYLNISQSNTSLATKVYHVVFSSIIGWTEWLENCREVEVRRRENVTLKGDEVSVDVWQLSHFLGTHWLFHFNHRLIPKK